jgi:hypothetical protein
MANDPLPTEAASSPLSRRALVKTLGVAAGALLVAPRAGSAQTPTPVAPARPQTPGMTYGQPFSLPPQPQIAAAGVAGPRAPGLMGMVDRGDYAGAQQMIAGGAGRAAQPNLGGALPSDTALAAQAQERQAEGLRNQQIADRMQANRSPAFATNPERQSYLDQALAAREGTGAWPGAWQGSIGDRVSSQPTERQLANRQGYQDQLAMRKRMVTARAQGSPITPEAAMASVKAFGGRPLSDEEMFAGWGAAPLWLRNQKQIGMAPYSPEMQQLERDRLASGERVAGMPYGDAAQRMASGQWGSNERIAGLNADTQREGFQAQREIAGLPFTPEARQADTEKARMGVLANLAGNQALPQWAMPVLANSLYGTGGGAGSQGASMAPVSQMMAATTSREALKQNPSISPTDLRSTMISQGVDPATAAKEAGRADTERAKRADQRWNSIKAMIPGGDYLEPAVQWFQPAPPATAGLPSEQLERIRKLAAEGNAEAMALLRRNSVPQVAPAAPAKPTVPAPPSASWAGLSAMR